MYKTFVGTYTSAAEFDAMLNKVVKEGYHPLFMREQRIAYNRMEIAITGWKEVSCLHQS